MARSSRRKPPRVYDGIVETIGNTPLVRLRRITHGIRATILAKLEYFNPGGSVKDRIGIAMIEAAEREGLIRPGYTIVEPTSGNTGMGLALAAIAKGYRVIFTIPDKMSAEKINLLKAFGARVIVTPTAVPPDHPSNYVRVAERIARETPNAFMPNQYMNPANPEAHYRTTGPEIWEQTGGKVDVVVAAMGTGGTISGTGRFLKEKNPALRIVGADPEGSMYHHQFDGTEVDVHPYRVEGIGEDFIPGTLDLGLVDEVVTVSDRDAFLTARRLVAEEGIFAGGSAGAAVYTALQAARDLPEGATVVTIVPDTGRSYLTKIYSDEWMAEYGYLESSATRIPVGEIVETKARRLSGVVAIAPEGSVQQAIDLMTEHDISQVPVVREGTQVGSVTERALGERLREQRAKEAGVDLGALPVAQVMEAPLPSVDVADRIINPFFLLRERNAVLVTKEGRIADILTTIDVITYLMRR